MQSIHQFTAGLNKVDAITSEAFAMRNIFRSWGHKSEIFSESKRISPKLRSETFDIQESLGDLKNSENIAILHLSIGSPVNKFFMSLECKKVILYHNITPSSYFKYINKKTLHDLEIGSAQLKMLVNAADINMADSKFNADELEKLGYQNVKVLPLILDFKKLCSEPDPATMKRWKDGKVNILFVGRCVPNKKIEDVLSAFSYFNKFIEPNSRFIHIGSHAGTEKYFNLLTAQVKNIENIYFAPSVSQPQLNAFYKCADIFLCMSEHEGFCIPVIESMYHNVPVMAYAAAAVPETMDGAGILFHEKKFDMIAEMMGKLTKDIAFKNAVLKKQQERINRFKQRDLETELKQHLKPLLEV
ncbi:glycosyltransferase [Verrucomicrobiota bacterium]